MGLDGLRFSDLQLIQLGLGFGTWAFRKLGPHSQASIVRTTEISMSEGFLGSACSGQSQDTSGAR